MMSRMNITGRLDREKWWRARRNRACSPPTPPRPKTVNRSRTRAPAPLVFWYRLMMSRMYINGRLEREKRWRTHRNKACPPPTPPEPKTLDSSGTRARVPLVFWDCRIVSRMDIIGRLEREKRWRTHQNRVCCPPAPPELKTLNISGTRVRTPLVFGNR